MIVSPKIGVCCHNLFKKGREGKVERFSTPVHLTISPDEISYNPQFCSVACVRWVDASDGQVPGGAWDALMGEAGSAPLFVGRAEHEGGVFPGTLVPALGVAHIPWGGVNYEKKTYQVKHLLVLYFLYCPRARQESKMKYKEFSPNEI